MMLHSHRQAGAPGRLGGGRQLGGPPRGVGALAARGANQTPTRAARCRPVAAAATAGNGASAPAAGPALAPSEHALKLWREANAVCFDVDCTITQQDSLDLLAEFMGVGDAVADGARAPCALPADRWPAPTFCRRRRLLSRARSDQQGDGRQHEPGAGAGGAAA